MEEMEERYEFNEVTLFSAFSVGEPGKRTFFLIIGQKERRVRAWLEKEQLEALALAFDQFLFKFSREHPQLSQEAEGIPVSDDVQSELPSAELEIKQITLGFDKERIALNFVVHALGPKGADQAELYCRVTLAQLKKLGDQAKSICAAGRPRCVLCGSPIDSTGHICPKNN